MDAAYRRSAEAARGFMPPDEGLALHAAAITADPALGPLLEVGSYCGKSSIYLASAAAELDAVVFCVDHHRGSEENQVGWDWHEPDLVDSSTGRIDTLPHFRRALHRAGLETQAVAVVGESTTVARHWAAPLSFLFIDGGHAREIAHADYEAWTPKVAVGGLLAIHDVFPNPFDGGRPPFEIYCRAIDSYDFTEVAAAGSLRVLRRVR